MTDLSAANSTYLPTSNEEPELNSISFHQSLRFFQDQLILNSKAFPSLSSSRVTNNDVIHFTNENHQVEKQLTLTKKDRSLDETSKPLHNSKISIPTVDTFLESVRVLRAIQKSQEQRGSSWSLNMSHSEADLTQQSFPPETERDKNANLFQSSNGALSISEDSKINSSDMTSNTEIDLSERNDKAQSFWPGHKIICQENIIDVDNTIVNLIKQKSEDLNEEKKEPKETSTSIDNTNDNQNTLEKNSPNINEDTLYEISEFKAYALASTEETLSDANLLSVTTDSGYNTSISNETTNLKYEENCDFTDMSSVTSSNFEEKTSEIASEKCKGINGENSDICNYRSDSVQDDVFYNEEPTKKLNGSNNKNGTEKSSITSDNFEEESKEIAKEISIKNTNQNGDIINNKFDSTQDDLIEISEWTNVFNGSNDKTEIQPSVLDTSAFQFMHFRPESTTDTCSSYYMSAEGSPCASLQNDFEQTIQTFENNLAYSSQCVNNEEKKDSPSEEWITDSSQICTSPENDFETRESVSSLSSASIDMNILEDHSMTDVLDVSSRTEELLNTTSNATENAKSINSDDDSYHSCSLLESNNTSPSFTNINTSVHEDELPDFSPKNRTNEINGNHIKETTGLLKSNGVNTEIENVNEFLIEKSFNTMKITTLNENEDHIEIHGVKKFTTASWNLEAIVESLYTLPEARISKELSTEKKFSKEVLVMSQGAFSNHPEGYYTMKLQQQSIVIMQENNTLLKLLLKYTDIFVNRHILQLENKVGRCLYIKCSTQEEATELKEEILTYSSECWVVEQINLVHYPLKYHQNVIIIDLGSCSTRAGILMDQPTLPFLFFPSVCATDKVTGNHVYGKEALQHDTRQNSNLSFPLRPSIKIIKHSLDVNLVEGLFKKIFQALKVNPTEYTIQVCLPRTISIQDQNSLVKLLLEDMKAQSVSLTHQAILTLYAHNVSTGIVVDIGDRMDILPVVDGFIVENGVTKLPYGGQRLIHHMKHALAEKHISLSNDIDSFVVQYISDNLSYIAEDYENEVKLASQLPEMVRKSIALEPFAKDNKCLQQAVLEDARFKVPEGLFKPSLWGLDNPGVHKLVQKAIQATSVDVRKKIAENIYISGGVTMTPGFVERLLKELSILNKPRITPKVIASRYRYHCTYIGACEFARMEVFPKVCVNAEEYSKKQLASLQKFVLCF